MRIAGLKVVDPKAAMVIRINKADVSKGKTKDPGSCAAALACKRSVAGCTDARVHLGRTYLKVDNKWLRFKTPRPLRTEIISFDRGAIFQPGEFRLQPLAPSDRATGKRQGTTTGLNKPKSKQKRRTYHVVSGVRQHGANR